MPDRSGLGTLLNNPFVEAALAAHAVGAVAGAYQQSEQRDQQDAMAHALATGGVTPTMPRTGLSGLIAKTGLISPSYNVDQGTQDRESLALQDRQLQTLQALGPVRAEYGPGIAKAPGLSRMFAQAGLSPDAVAEPTLAERKAGEAQKKDAATEQWRQTTEKRLEGSEAAREQDRTESRQFREQQAAATNQMREMTLQMQKDSKDTNKRIAEEKDQQARQSRFNQATRNLDADRQKVAAMLTSSSPADPKTVQTLLDHLNSRASSLRESADKYGYEYDPSQFEALTVSKEKTWNPFSSKNVVTPKGETDTTGGKATAEPGATPTPAALAKDAPTGASSAIVDASGKVVAYRMKDGSRRSASR